MATIRKRDLPVDASRRFLEPGPVLLLCSAHGDQRAFMTLGWHMMLGGGVVMTLVFAWIRWVAFPPTRRAAATDDLPGAATGLGRIRLLVVANLVIGILTIAAATLAA